MADFRLVGVLHLPALPGAANYAGTPVREIAERAAEDAAILAASGFTHVMVQDASDLPQPTVAHPAAVAALAVVGAAVAASSDLELGVIVGHNDGPASVAVAHAVGARFVRVKVLTGVAAGPSGLISGCAVEVAQTRRLLGSDIEVWADAHEATSRALAGDLAWAAREAVAFGAADAVLVTRDSGAADAVAAIGGLRAELDGVPLIVGGRVSLTNLGAVLDGADGAVIGNALKVSDATDARIDLATARRFGDALRIHRKAA